MFVDAYKMSTTSATPLFTMTILRLFFCFCKCTHRFCRMTHLYSEQHKGDKQQCACKVVKLPPSCKISTYKCCSEAREDNSFWAISANKHKRAMCLCTQGWGNSPPSMLRRFEHQKSHLCLEM